MSQTEIIITKGHRVTHHVWNKPTTVLVFSPYEDGTLVCWLAKTRIGRWSLRRLGLFLFDEGRKQ